MQRARAYSSMEIMSWLLLGLWGVLGRRLLRYATGVWKARRPDAKLCVMGR